MKKITTLLTAIIGMAFMNQVSATHVTVEVPTAGQLSSLVQNANCDSITISGNLDGNDFWFIREQMPNLIYLNITNFPSLVYTQRKHYRRSYFLTIWEQ
jgi:hypothetical protein